jgi:hypothetical protein
MAKESPAPLRLECRYTEEADAFFRALVFSEEERLCYTIASWGGGYRWFESANVVPIERYRRISSIT